MAGYLNGTEPEDTKMAPKMTVDRGQAPNYPASERSMDVFRRLPQDVFQDSEEALRHLTQIVEAFDRLIAPVRAGQAKFAGQSR